MVNKLEGCSGASNSVELFRVDNRFDLANRDATQLAVPERSLSQHMSDEEPQRFVDAGVEKSGANLTKDMRKVMDVLAHGSVGRINGRRHSAAVRASLASESRDRPKSRHHAKCSLARYQHADGGIGEEPDPACAAS